jgi:hypothetical protein
MPELMADIRRARAAQGEDGEGSAGEAAGVLTLAAPGRYPITLRGSLDKQSLPACGTVDRAETEQVWEVVAVRAVIQSAPDYLFANARYATPIRFRIEAGPRQLSFAETEPLLDTARVLFYAANGDGTAREHLRFTTLNLAPEGDKDGRICRVYPNPGGDRLRLLGHGDSSGPNLYEAYVPSSRFRKDVKIANGPTDKHVTRHAHFQVEVAGRGLTVRSDPLPEPDQGPERNRNGHWKDRGPRITLFGDRTLAAWDMRPSGFSGTEDMFTTRLGACTVVPLAGMHSTNTVCVELAHWAPNKGLANEDYINNRWTLNHCTGESGVREKNICRKWGAWYGTRSNWTFKMPYWTRHGRGFVELNPLVCPTTVDYDHSLRKWKVIGRNTSRSYKCFEDLYFLSSYGNTLTSSVVMRQSKDNTYKGEYVAKNYGMRMGGYLIASYGGKIPPSLEDSAPVAVPWRQYGNGVAEWAMDLQKEDASVKMEVGNGFYCLTTDTNRTKVGNPGPWVDMAFALGDAAIALSGQVYLLLVSGPLHASTKLVVADAARFNETHRNATSMAKMQGYYMFHDPAGNQIADAQGKAWLADGTKAAEANGTSSSGHMTVASVKGGHHLQVGKQFTLWLDITCQAQLVAQDTWRWHPGVHSCSASAAYTKNSLGPRDIRISVYERGQTHQ